MSNITLTIPNDDHVALRAFGKALEEMALAHGAEPQAQTLVRERVADLEVEYLTRDAAAERLRVATEDLRGKREEPEVDTTALQVESLGVSTVQDLGGSEPVGDETKYPIDGADSTGTPWDERIHSASKALNADGTWRLRRKPKDMDEAEWAALVESVKLELNGAPHNSDSEAYMNLAHAIIKPPVTSQNDDPLETPEPTREEIEELIAISNKTVEPPVTPPGDEFHGVTEQTVAGIPPIPVPPPVVVPPAPVYDFPGLMKFLTERHGKIDVPTVNQLLAVDGLAALTDLNAHPDKIGPFVARVKAHLGE